LVLAGSRRPPPFRVASGPPSTRTSSLSLHDALPICASDYHRHMSTLRILLACLLASAGTIAAAAPPPAEGCRPQVREGWVRLGPDRKSTRLNSSHVKISYAVFCLKKKNKTIRVPPRT